MRPAALLVLSLLALTTLGLVACRSIGRASEHYEACDSADADQAYQEARLYINAGEYEQALPRLRQTVELCPDFIKGHLLYQDAAIHAGSDAETAMREYYANFESEPDPALGMYLSSRLVDNNRDRLVLLNRVIARDDTFYRAYLDKAGVYRRSQRTGRALDELRNAVMAQPASVEANQAIAEVMVQLGRYSEAASHYRTLLRLNPSNQQVKKDYLSLLIYELGELGDAEVLVDDLLGFDDLDVEALMDKAAIAWLRGDLQAAQHSYQQILRLDSSRSEAVLNLGNLYYQALAGDSEAGRLRFWPKARLAYTYYLEHSEQSTAYDQLDQWLTVPMRLREIDKFLGPRPDLPISLRDF
ncbi:MAG: tetratricopeptide repeat protein [Planctomycetota bacterium]|jgi:tetratricopeptide (TPR) repeat protein